MINNIRFKIIAGKINKIPEFYTIFARKNVRLYNKTTRTRPGRGQSFEAEVEAETEAEAKSLSPSPRPKFWPRGGLGDLTSLILNNYFCHNFVKFPQTWHRKMANSLKLYETHSFSTWPNSRQRTTVINADVPNDLSWTVLKPVKLRLAFPRPIFRHWACVYFVFFYQL